MAEEQDLKMEEGEAAPKKGKMMLIIIIVVAVLVLAGGGAAAYFLLFAEEEVVAEEGAEEEKEEEIPEEPPIPAEYVVLKPEFIVGFQSGTRQRFLQVSIEVMTRKQTVVDALALHEPMIRNEVLQAIGEQDFDALRTNEGRLALQKQIADRMTAALDREAYIEPGGIEAVLFTNYVMQ